MRIPRLYQPGDYTLQTELHLSASATQHATRVLRLTVGDEVILFDGEGHSCVAVINSQEKKKTSVTIKKQLNQNTESPLNIHLALCISKGERMDYAIQKVVEAGVHSITPIVSERVVVKLDEKRRQSRYAHWQGIIISACEQSGRNLLPTLHPISDYSHFISQNHAGLRLMFDVHATTPMAKIEKQETVTTLIGPEGGFSQAEVDSAIANGFAVTQLGPRILRTETAALAACVSLQTRWGDY